MSANPRPAYGAVYPHRSDNPDRENSPAYHRRRFYCLGGFRYIFRRTGGTWKRHSFITDFTLPVCCGYHPNCVFSQQAFRSGWRLECVLDHGSDFSNHFYLCLLQGNSTKLAELVNSKMNVAPHYYSERGISMTVTDVYQEYIRRKHNAFCKAFIRYAAIGKITRLRQKWEREIYLDYLTNVSASQIPWAVDDDFTKMLPVMQTDIHLQKK